jgi:hypothetical protein
MPLDIGWISRGGVKGNNNIGMDLRVISFDKVAHVVKYFSQGICTGKTLVRTGEVTYRIG